MDEISNQFFKRNKPGNEIQYLLYLEDVISLESSVISDYYYLSTFSSTQIPELVGEGSEKYPGLWLQQFVISRYFTVMFLQQNSNSAFYSRPFQSQVLRCFNKTDTQMNSHAQDLFKFKPDIILVLRRGKAQHSLPLIKTLLAIDTSGGVLFFSNRVSLGVWTTFKYRPHIPEQLSVENKMDSMKF